jgi:hypothetical protein
MADVERYMAYRSSIFQLQPGEIILDERLLSDTIQKGIPISPEDSIQPIETPNPDATLETNSSTQFDETEPLLLPQIRN